MVQEIITYLILASAFGLAGYKLYQTVQALNIKKKNQAGCSYPGCGKECPMKSH